MVRVQYEREWLQNLEKSVHNMVPHGESLYHYRKYKVIKMTYDPETKVIHERAIAFRVPKREGEIIIRSQKTETQYLHGELVYLQSYKLQEEE